MQEPDRAPCALCGLTRATRYGTTYYLSWTERLFLCTLCKGDRSLIRCIGCQSEVGADAHEVDFFADKTYTTPSNTKMVYCHFDCGNRHQRRLRDEGMSRRLGRSCRRCDKIGRHYKCCSRCLKIYYCSPDCQRADWPQHRATCRRE